MGLNHILCGEGSPQLQCVRVRVTYIAICFLITCSAGCVCAAAVCYIRVRVTNIRVRVIRGGIRVSVRVTNIMVRVIRGGIRVRVRVTNIRVREGRCWGLVEPTVATILPHVSIDGNVGVHQRVMIPVRNGSVRGYGY